MNTQPSTAMMGLAREKIMLTAALDVPVQEAPVVVVRREERQKARPYVHESNSETGGRGAKHVKCKAWPDLTTSL